MNCNKCGTQKTSRPIQTCCELTGTLITINLGQCSCDDNKDDDDLPSRMLDHGERPTVSFDPREVSEGILRKISSLKNLQRMGRSIGIEN